MYIAIEKNNGQAHYFLRESCTIEEQLTFRTLFDLGPDPSAYIIYAGGNAFYFDETMEDTLAGYNSDYDSDELEDLLWPWIRPDIRRAIDTFRNRSSTSGRKKLSAKEKKQIAVHVHSFDKRRIHYLKFANMDQGPVENMPAVLFKNLVRQSRDEIEQHFLKQEFALKAHELKSYVYTVFDLQYFFSGLMAKRMPHVLDQEKVDHYFLKELCHLNNELFHSSTWLDDYLIRYLIMFFDHQYANTTLLDDFAKDFMFRNRSFKPRRQKSISIKNACKVFKITPEIFQQLTSKELTRHYRELARKVHPDTGGTHEQFVELNTAYESLSEKIKSRKRQ